MSVCPASTLPRLGGGTPLQVGIMLCRARDGGGSVLSLLSNQLTRAPTSLRSSVGDWARTVGPLAGLKLTELPCGWWWGLTGEALPHWREGKERPIEHSCWHDSDGAQLGPGRCTQLQLGNTSGSPARALGLSRCLGVAGWCLGPARTFGRPLTCPVSQGYEGLVEGGDNIKPATWLSVSNIIQLVRVDPALPVHLLGACASLCSHSPLPAPSPESSSNSSPPLIPLSLSSPPSSSPLRPPFLFPFSSSSSPLLPCYPLPSPMRSAGHRTGRPPSRGLSCPVHSGPRGAPR